MKLVPDFQLMRQAVGLLEDISVQANNHLAKVLMTCHNSQCLLAFLQALLANFGTGRRCQGIEESGDSQGNCVKGDVHPAVLDFVTIGPGLNMGV